MRAHASGPRGIGLLAATAMLLAVAAGCGGDDSAPAAGGDAAAPPAAERGTPVLAGRATSIEGRPIRLGDYRGRVVVVLNMASRCGFTDQMGAWESVYRQKRGEGLVVIGYPSDDFRQEPLDDAEIADFCEKRYGVTFPLIEKGPVTGPRAAPPFDEIAARPAPLGGPPTWNFTAFAIDREGRLAGRVEPGVGPDAGTTTALLEELLAEPAPAPTT